MDENYITLEVDDEGCGRLQFELPLDITDEEIAHIKAWCRAPSPDCSNS